MADAATTTTTPATDTPATNPATDTHSAAPATDQQQDSTTKLDALIQSAVDRATNKLGNENKKLRSENETLRKANLDKDELKKLELSEKEKEIAEREKALTEKENRLIAIKEIKAAGLDDGSDASLAIVDFVMAEDEDGIKERVKAFNTLVTGLVQKKVDAVFKASGRTPGVGSDTASNAGGQNESIAARMGKSTAAANQKAQDTRNYYVNGGKK